MRQLRNGSLLFLVLATLTSCRSTNPPPVSVCIGDGFGGADCQLTPTSPLVALCQKNADGSFFCPPTALVNTWTTSQAEMAAFSSWCFDVPVSVTSASMEKIKMAVRK
jgi:hypothetical protein